MPPAYPRPPPATRRSAAPLFGWDIFISFALGEPPRGTTEYARALNAALLARGLTVFFSEEAGLAGSHLGSALQAQLHRARVLVVLANHDTLLDPRWVRNEVLEFRRRHPRRTIVPINIASALQDEASAAAAQPWLDHRDRVWIDESADALCAGRPSEDVVAKVARACTSIRSAIRWRWLLGGLVIMFAALAAGAGGSAWRAWLAEGEATRAKSKADIEAKRAKAAEQDAVLAAERAARAASAAELARGEEQKARERAERSDREAQTYGVAEASTTQLAAGHVRRALLAAATAWRVEPTARAEEALRAALDTRPNLERELNVTGARQLALAGGGEVLLALRGGGELSGWDSKSGEPIPTYTRGDRYAAPGARLFVAPDGFGVGIARRGLFTLWSVPKAQELALACSPVPGALAAFHPVEPIVAVECLDDPADWPLRPESRPRPGATRSIRFFDRPSGQALAFRLAPPDDLAAIGFAAGRPGELIVARRNGEVSAHPYRSGGAPRVIRQAGSVGAPRVVTASIASESGTIALVLEQTRGSSDTPRDTLQVLALGSIGQELPWRDDARSLQALPEYALVDTLALDPAGRHLVVGLRNGRLIHFDLRVRQTVPAVPLDRMSGPIIALAVDRDGLVAAGGASSDVVLHRVGVAGSDTTAKAMPQERFLLHAPSRRQTAVVTADGDLHLQPAAGGARTQLALPAGPPIRRLDFSADERVLAAHRGQSPTLVWDLRQPARAPRALPPGTLHPDGRHLLLDRDGRSGPLRLVSIDDSSRVLATFEPPETGDAGATAFSTDGRRLAVVVNGRIFVWRTAAPREAPVATETQFPEPLAAQFDADGALLTQHLSGVARWPVAGATAVLKPDRLWLTAPGSRPLQSATALAVEPRQGWIAMAVDGGVHLWRHDEPRAIGPPVRSALATIVQLSFDANGRRLFVSGAGGAVEAIDLAPGEWFARACRAAGRNPSCEEWQRWRPGHLYYAVCPQWPAAACGSGGGATGAR